MHAPTAHHLNPQRHDTLDLAATLDLLADRVKTEVRGELAGVTDALQRAQEAEALATTARAELAKARAELGEARREFRLACEEAEKRTSIATELYILERDRANELAAWKADLLARRWPWQRAAILRAARRETALSEAAGAF